MPTTVPTPAGISIGGPGGWPGTQQRHSRSALRRRISFSCSSVRFRRFSSRSSADSELVSPGRTPSSTSAILSQRCRHDSEIPKSFAICDTGASPLRATATTSRRNSTGMPSASDHPSSEDQILTRQESTEPTAVPCAV